MLELEEEAIVLREKDLSHQVVVLGHLKQIHDIKVSVESLLAFLELYVFLSPGYFREATLSATAIEP